jgi:hypothetical protein
VEPLRAGAELEPLRSLPKPSGMKLADSSIFNAGAGHNALVEFDVDLEAVKFILSPQAIRKSLSPVTAPR